MSVGAHTEQDQIEARNAIWSELEKFAQSLFVIIRDPCSIRILGGEAKHISGGTGIFDSIASAAMR